MIIDTIQNASQYYSVHPLLERAFDYIRQNYLVNTADGKSVIGEGLLAILSNAPGKTAATSLAKFECHYKHVDIQLCVSGNETIGWKPRSAYILPNGDYNEEKDVRFFSDAPDTFLQLTDGQFAVFFPEDVHAPMIGEGTIKRLVIKVKI